MSARERTGTGRYWALLAVLLLGLVGSAIWMFSRDAGQPEASQHEVDHHAQQEGVAYYTCSMHPSVQQPSPGKCPICGMDLTPVKQEDLDSGTIVVDEVRRQQIGVRTAAVERRNISRQIRAVGQVKLDETRLSDVNLRMSGWVHRLHVEETGQRVKRGQVLFTLYSPELYAAEREYLSTLKRDREARSDTSSELTRASEQRLRLLGMSQAQIRELRRRGEAWENVPVLAPSTGYVIDKDVVEGGRIEAGTRVYRIADLSRLWVDAEVYEADLAQVKKGQPVSVQLPYVPGQSFEGQGGLHLPNVGRDHTDGSRACGARQPRLDAQARHVRRRRARGGPRGTTRNPQFGGDLHGASPPGIRRPRRRKASPARDRSRRTSRRVRRSDPWPRTRRCRRDFGEFSHRGREPHSICYRVLGRRAWGSLKTRPA